MIDHPPITAIDFVGPLRNIAMLQVCGCGERFALAGHGHVTRDDVVIAACPSCGTHFEAQAAVHTSGAHLQWLQGGWDNEPPMLVWHIASRNGTLPTPICGIPAATSALSEVAHGTPCAACVAASAIREVMQPAQPSMPPALRLIDRVMTASGIPPISRVAWAHAYSAAVAAQDIATLRNLIDGITR